jgi:hypothetical protein
MDPLSIIGGVGSALGGAFGGGGGGPATATMGDFNFGGSTKQQAELSKVRWYVIGGVAVVGLVLLAAWLFKRK